MLRKNLNQARLQFAVTPRGPLLIKSGRQTTDPTRPKMEFVRTHHAELGETIYLPGTSLKGPLRSHAERVFRGLGIRGVCVPFDEDSECRSDKEGKNDPAAAIFRRQCPICRTFGSTRLSGRLNVTDAYPWPPNEPLKEQQRRADMANRTEKRFQVGISREKGCAQGSSLFDLEVAVHGTFHAELHLQNFELWQLGLVFALFREIDAGLVPVGFGKSRGLGQVGITTQLLDLRMSRRSEAHLLGAGAMLDETERAAYDLLKEDVLDLSSLVVPAEPGGPTCERSWRGSRWTFNESQLPPLVDRLLDGPLNDFVELKSDPPAGEAS